FHSTAGKEYFTTPREPDARPLSVGIIAWYFLVMAVGRASGAVLRTPGMVFGFLFTGWTSAAIFTALAAVHIYLGAGLLQLQESSRIASIAFFGLMAVNGLVTGQLPDLGGRMQTLQQSVPILRGIQTAGALDGVRRLMLTSALMAAVPIWFLVRRRA